CGRKEDLRVGPVPDPSAGDALLHLAHDAQLGGILERGERAVRAGTVEHTGLTVPERHRPGLAVTVDLDVETRRERVDHGRADTVQAAGGRVAATAELTAGVQFGEDEFD